MNGHEELGHAMETPSECVYPWRQEGGPVCWQMVRRGLCWPDTSFCPQPSAAHIVFPTGVELGSISCFCMSIERIIIYSINKEYSFVMKLGFSLLALFCQSFLETSEERDHAPLPW